MITVSVDKGRRPSVKPLLIQLVMIIEAHVSRRTPSVVSRYAHGVCYLRTVGGSAAQGSVNGFA